ncbi:sensor histidine kinase [Jongsikchunia kroppenstedtii]|uniref:sensor histidine kinase n=1 Tax=Jongsikchunia kroppenstedtii TaxID=1121721 RepID=UPI0005B90449|nr:sensor histidine kinase [Jongsikchunia kroppenstedtii]
MRARTTPADAAIAVACFAVFTGPQIAHPAAGTSAWAAAALGAAAILPTVWSRRFPVPALLAVATVLLIASLADVRFTGFVSNAGPAFGIAVAWVAYRLPWRQSLAYSLLASTVTLIGGWIAFAMHSQHDQDAVQLAVAVPAWLIGTLAGRERSHRRQHLAEQHETEKQAEARIRAEERLRVSRDIHDVVSHTLSMIALRSGVARVVLDTDPTEARNALSAIEESSRAALDEVRGVLRTARTDLPPISPQLADLDDLVVTDWPGDLRIQLADNTDHADLDRRLQTTAYRIVQEALTNVVRHADAGLAVVTIVRVDGSMVVRVVDDGIGAASEVHEGLGLTGMRERVAAHGGTLSVGNVAGGYQVEAVIPL